MAIGALAVCQGSQGAEDKSAGISSLPISVPFRLLHNNIYVNAELSSGKQAVFLVDTGCTTSAIDEDAVRRLNLGQIVDNKNEGSEQRWVKLPVLKLGSSQIKDVSLRVRDLSRLHAPSGCTTVGIIGESILKQYRVKFDFGHQMLTLDDPNNPTLSLDLKPSKVRHYDDGSGIIFDASLDHKVTIPFLLDTGSSVNLIPDNLIQTVLNKPLVPDGEIGGLAGETVKTAEVSFNSFRIGEYEAKEPVFWVKLLNGRKKCDPGCVLENDSFATVGPAIWGKATLIIDYKNMTLSVDNAH